MTPNSEVNIRKITNLTEDQYEILFKLSETLNSSSYKETLIEEALDLLVSAIDAERGLFARYNESSQSFKIVSARNLEKESISNLSEFSSGLLQKIIAEKKPLLYHDVTNAPGVSQFESIQIHKIKSVVAVPIIRNESIWGVLLADSQLNRKEFTEENLLFLSFFSNLFSLALDKLIAVEFLENENILLRKELEKVEKVPDIIGESKPMKDLFNIIRRVASSEATVLITGESGTGKELVARAIHKLSSRRDNPFIAQFCGSIPDSLLESELFGYKKGAFTGADSDKKGLLEVAESGTFFLDEIADISPSLQAKLLRVIENREIIRLGDTKVTIVNVRILTATNKDLKQLVKDGVFREDLYYRLNVFPIKLPSLRERAEDITIIAKHYLENIKKSNIRLKQDALQKLQNYMWPGNVRQLLNILERALILSDGENIHANDIIFDEEKSLSEFQGTLKEFEMMLLKKRLDEFGGNKSLVAESLGVSVRWVQMKIKEIE